MKLLLFDIDGTILLTHGVGRRAVERSLARVSGRPVHTEGVSFSGKTDPQIIREVAGVNDLRLHDDLFRAAVEAYMAEMHASLDPDHVQLLPGVRPLVEHLHREERVQLALLTGNFEPMAYLKLRSVGLDGFFPFGAFGSDHESRADLPAIALDRAERFTGRRFRGKDIIIVGDTEHDITCGRGVGAFSVAVCTGRYSRGELDVHRPDCILEDLSDLDLFIRHILLVEQA